MDSRKRLTVISVCLLLSGCATDFVGNMLGHVPGDTIKVVSSSPQQITYAYTHSYIDPSELPIASQRADDWCRSHAKRATLVQNTRVNMDRSTATFTCS